MAASSKRTYATLGASKVCCSQSSCPYYRPLLTRTSAGETQTLKGMSGSVSMGSLGPVAHKVLFELLECLWCIQGLILNMISSLLPFCCGFSFVLGHGISFFGGIQHSPVDGCSATSCSFGVLAGEDDGTSFYFAILAVKVSITLTLISDITKKKITDKYLS